MIVYGAPFAPLSAMSSRLKSKLTSAARVMNDMSSCSAAGCFDSRIPGLEMMKGTIDEMMSSFDLTNG